MTLIETMPLGEVEVDRTDQFLSLKDVRRDLSIASGPSTDLAYATGGPARYVRVEETGGRLGFITPLSHNFCEACNRVRLTCTGTLHTCLGRDDASDLRAVIRDGADDAGLERRHPRGHRRQAPGPRLPHRPRRGAGRGPPHVDARAAEAMARVLLFGRLADAGRLARTLRRRRVAGGPPRRPARPARATTRPWREALAGPGVQVATSTRPSSAARRPWPPRPRWRSCRR